MRSSSDKDWNQRALASGVSSLRSCETRPSMARFHGIAGLSAARPAIGVAARGSPVNSPGVSTKVESGRRRRPSSIADCTRHSRTA